MKKILLVLLCLFIITGCKNNNVIENKENENKTEEVKEEIKEEKKVQVIDLDSKTRPVAVMINNIKVAQPYQTGLNDAYIVYELIVEGGITRMMALFKDKDTSQIGTIRSSRHNYLDYVLENDAIYVHFGGSDKALAEIPSFGINNLNGMAHNFYWRDKSLPVSSEHTVYSSMERINKEIAKRGYRTTTDTTSLLKYSADEIDLSKMEGATKADKVKIVYSNVQTNEFIYDEETKLYTRKSNGTVRKDYITGKPFTTKNIITYQVENYTMDSYGRQDLKNVGSGEGYYISSGYAVKITWQKDSRSGKTTYKYLDGTELVVNDGNTYIQIQPKGKTINITANEVKNETGNINE